MNIILDAIFGRDTITWVHECAFEIKCLECRSNLPFRINYICIEKFSRTEFSCIDGIELNAHTHTQAMIWVSVHERLFVSYSMESIRMKNQNTFNHNHKNTAQRNKTQCNSYICCWFLVQLHRELDSISGF